MEHGSYMNSAISEADEGIRAEHGGPFGAIIISPDGEITGFGHNRVLQKGDPTRHGEMEAIRDHCDATKDFDLSGHIMYTTAEPCLMCLGASLWANIDTVYYGASVEDTNDIGFRDDIFDKYLTIDRTKLKEDGFLVQVERDACLELFKRYVKSTEKRY